MKENKLKKLEKKLVNELMQTPPSKNDLAGTEQSEEVVDIQALIQIQNRVSTSIQKKMTDGPSPFQVNEFTPESEKNDDSKSPPQELLPEYFTKEKSPKARGTMASDKRSMTSSEKKRNIFSKVKNPFK